MPDSPSTADRVTKLLPAVVLGLIGVTATALVGFIGIVALLIIWILLLAFVSLTYAAKWRSDLERSMAERQVLQDQVTELRTKLGAKTPKDEQLDALQREASAWKAQLEESELERRRLEAELAEREGKAAVTASEDTRGRTVLIATQLTCVNPPQLPGPPLKEDEEGVEDLPYDFAAKRLKRGAVIDVLADSDRRFGFFLFGEDNFRRYQERRRNTSATAGKGNVTVYREQVIIPHGGEWFFLVEPQVEGEDVEVRLRVVRVNPDDL